MNEQPQRRSIPDATRDEINRLNDRLDLLIGDSGIAGVKSDVRSNGEKLERFETLLEKLVTRSEFEPIRLIVYGLCGSILMGVLAAILSKVITK